MALFCKTCAKRHGFIEDEKPLLCEGCGKEYLTFSYRKFIIYYLKKSRTMLKGLF